MKKFISFNLSFVLLLLCGCTYSQENSDTRFLLNTVVSLSAVGCNDELLDDAFELCEEYEKLLSRTVKGSEVHTLNSSGDFVEVSDDTLQVVKKSLYYAKLSGGKFDITICPVTSLWDFNNQVVPSHDEIAEALKNVDYQSIEIIGNKINLNGTQIDLGGIAKGYIADKLLEYFKNNNIQEGKINLGGNLILWGDHDYTVGIKQPFTDDKTAATIILSNKTVVTSGTYERYIKKSDILYHHILDPNTGYAVNSDICSATIIGNSSLDADALSTICILVGLDKAKQIIENTADTEAVFIDNDGKLHHTSGLLLKDNVFTLK